MHGFWIKDNLIIEITGSSHIGIITLHPKLFEMTLKSVKHLFKKHHEKLFTEGNAREELIKLAAQNAWIRVRKYPTYWSIQFNDLKKRKAAIYNFVFWAIKNKMLMKHDSVKFTGFDDGTQFQQMASEFLRENKKYEKIIKLKVVSHSQLYFLSNSDKQRK